MYAKSPLSKPSPRLTAVTSSLQNEYILDETTGQRLKVVRRENGRGEKMIYTVNEDNENHGDYKVFTPDNKVLISHAIYKNGIFHGPMASWHYNCKKSFEGTFKDGKAEGIQQNWDANGILRSKFFYSAGKLDGEYKVWHPDGQLEEEATYVEGRRVGWHRFWPSSGKLGFERYYNPEVGTSPPKSVA
jgi:antitoxin component YwqK of YwqJK toxin-antitoxin module